ncbi:capsular biosynthesis protein, partial [Thioclava sp. BHET1]
RLPYHAAAQNVGKALDLRCWAIEFGYLRPDWLTLERDGMGARSHFPRTAEGIAALAQDWDAPDLKAVYTHGFATEAFMEVSFNLLMVYGRPAYPLYRSDKRYWPALEYLSWLPLLVQEGAFNRHAAAVEKLAQEGLDYNLIAMQMQGDYQIRESSPYRDLADFLRDALSSFARHAPPERHVVIKLHPLESGLPQWGRRIRKIVRDLGLEARVHVMRGGDLHHMLRHSKGAVMVNSTVGIHALRLGVPVCALGAAVYRVAGLTHERPLDQFWTDPAPVDSILFDQFCRALQSIQVKGSFFNAKGRQVAIAEMTRRLLA